MVGKTDLGQLSARVSLDTVDFSKNLAAIKRELKTAKTDFDLAGKGIHGFGDDVSSGAAQLKLLERQMGLQSQKMKRFKDDYATASSKISEENRSTSRTLQNLQNNYAQAQLETARLTEEYKKLYLAQAQGDSSFYKAGTSLTSFGTKLESISKKAGKFADSWMKVGAVVGVGAGVIIKQALEWESAVASMSKTIDATPEAFGQMTDGIREMSLEVPVAASELAELASIAGQLGIENDSILSFTETIAALGVTTNVSSEEAAKSLAQFANVTKMSQDNFSNLGSSIVDLGNNFSTTEESIITMSQRLAGAGEQVGLSEAEIVGVATALSSLGIEAEMGGSAFSKLMINMAVASDTGLDKVRELEAATGLTSRQLELMSSNNSKDFKALADSMGMTTSEITKIVKAGNSLEDFGRVAGMTAEEFKKAYEEDAVGAISAFVQGLGNATDKGETAITMLDEMGISEIRLRDTLLRTGSAQELFTDAVNTSTKAWEENTALTDEANIRYETTASQLQLLKNEVTGMAIDLGTELLPVLLDFVEMAKPMMEGIKDMIRGFADSSDETKKFVGSMLGLVVAGGPVLKVFTSLGQGIGLTTKLLGNGMTKLFDYVKGAEATAAATKALSGSTDVLTGSAAKLAGNSGMGAALTTSSSFLGTLGPLALGVAGVTAAVALGYGAWKLWGEEAYNSSERTKKWGSDIGEEADKAATEFVEMADEIALATEKMAVDVEGGASQVIETYGEMGDSIVTDIQETITEAEKGLATLPESVREIVGESLMEGIGEKEELVTEVQTIQSEITAIYQQAMEENREISENELTIIENYNNRLAEIRSETLGLEAEEQKKVHAIMAEDLKNFTKEQLIQREWLIGEEQVAVKKGYAENRELLESELASGALVQKEYDAAMSALRNEEITEMTALGAEYVKIWRERGGVSKEVQEAALKDLGVTMEQVEQYLALNNEKVKNASNIMIESSEEASAKTKEANEAWNSMELLDKEGNVKTNVKEVIQEASQSEEGWEQLQFIMHNAELDTNAMEIIRDALMAEGKWWQIELPAKFAEMQTNSPEEAIKFLQAHGIWESLPFETQTAILDSNSTEEVANIMKDHEAWKKIPWRERQALVSTNTKQTVTTATKGHATWEGQKWNDKHAKINVTTNAQSVSAIARREIGSVTGKTVILKTRYETSGSAPRGIGPTATRSAAGSNFLKGGPTILGDGGNHEPFMTPDGQFGLSPKQDTLYDLPRGTKVWRNIESLLSSLPHYANGTLNQPIKVGDKTFNQLTDALIPFSAPSVTQQSETRSESSSATHKIEGDTYNINISANGDLPRTTIERLARDVTKAIKREETNRKASKGLRTVNTFG